MKKWTIILGFLVSILISVHILLGPIGIYIGGNYYISYAGVYYNEPDYDNNGNKLTPAIQKLSRNNIVKGATLNKLNVVKDDVLKDMNNVYIKNEKVDFINPSSFEYLNFTYSKDDKNVYLYMNEPIQIADTKTFEVVDFNVAKDKNNVYFQGSIIEDAMPGSFDVIKGCNELYRDQNHVFSRAYKFDIVEDINTFTCINKSYSEYYKDSKSVYRYDDDYNLIPVLGFDPKTFIEVPGCPYLYKDKETAIQFRTVLTGIDDIETFKCIDGSITDFKDYRSKYKLDQKTNKLIRV